MAWDPLSAHGLTIALRSGIDAADAILAALKRRVSALEDYSTTLRHAWYDYTVLRARIYAEERRWPAGLPTPH